MKLYPYGACDQDTKKELIIFVKDLLGKALNIDSSVDFSDLVIKWFTHDCYPLLLKEDKDTEFRSALEITVQVIYPIDSEFDSIESLCEAYRKSIPRKLKANDYIPARKLLDMLSEII